jgi:hypothetical protein
MRELFSLPGLSLVESHLMSLLNHMATMANDSGPIEPIPADMAGPVSLF